MGAGHYKKPYINPEVMRLGDYLPVHIIRVGPSWTQFYRAAAEAKHKDTGYIGVERWLGGMIVEAALYVHLRELGKWKSWLSGVFFGEREEAGHDFITSFAGELESLGIRGRRHEEMERYAEGDEVVIFYPAREAFEVARYIIGASYKFVYHEDEEDESAYVAFWGAIAGSEIIKKLTDEQNYPHRFGHPSYIEIPLAEWDRELLRQIEQTRDEQTPGAFLRLKEQWGGQSGLEA